MFKGQLLRHHRLFYRLCLRVWKPQQRHFLNRIGCSHLLAWQATLSSDPSHAFALQQTSRQHLLRHWRRRDLLVYLCVLESFLSFLWNSQLGLAFPHDTLRIVTCPLAWWGALWSATFTLTSFDLRLVSSHAQGWSNQWLRCSSGQMIRWRPHTPAIQTWEVPSQASQSS